MPQMTLRDDHAFACRVSKIARRHAGPIDNGAICPPNDLLRRLDLDEGAEARERLAHDQPDGTAVIHA